MKRATLIFSMVLLNCVFFLGYAQNAWFNEIHYDNASTDQGEMIEVVIENASNYTLSDFTVHLYNGNNGTVYGTGNLGSFTQGATSGGFTFFYFNYPADGIQNGAPDGMALAYQGSLISGQFLSYEGGMTGADGPAMGVASVDIGVMESSATLVGQSLQLSGTGTAYSQFVWQLPATATAGLANNNQIIGAFTPDPEPTNYPTSFAAIASGLSVDLSWTDAVGTQLPAAYLILASDVPTFVNPVDGVPVSDDLDLSDGSGAKNVQYGAQAFNFSGLDPNTTYYFAIFSYTNLSTFIDYKVSPASPQANATTGSIITALNFNDNTFGSWDTISVASNKNWFIDVFGTDIYAKISGYQGNVNSDDWLISPPLAMDSYVNEVLSFTSASNYTGPALEVLISSNYTGGNPTAASWTALPATLSSGSWTWTSSGSIDLSLYTGSVNIAFRYTSTATDAATWELDNIAVTGSPANLSQPVLNEFLSDNELAYIDPSDNQYDDWIEIYNPTTSPINLLNYALSDDHLGSDRWYFPDTSVAAGDYLIVWADGDTNDPGLHADFSLSNSGEEIYFYNVSGQVIDSVVFGQQYEDTTYARIPDGFGSWVFAKPTPMAQNALFPIIVIDTTAPLVISAQLLDASNIEITFSEPLNATAENVANYSGVGAINTAIRSGNLEKVTLNLSAALNSGQVYVLVISAVEDTSGNALLNPHSEYLVWGPISANLVITEIMYNPPEVGMDSLEYIEIYNNGVGPVPLQGFYFSAGVDLVFPSSLIGAGDYLIVAGNANAVMGTFGINDVIQWTSGGLVNTSEAVVLKAPDGATVDSVKYADAAPWPTTPDGFGSSLVLCDPSLDNTLAANWASSVEFAAVNANGDTILGTPGSACAGTGIFNPSSLEISWEYYPVPASEYIRIQMPNGKWTVRISDVSGKLNKIFESVVSNDQLDVSNLRPGLYIIQLSGDEDKRTANGKLLIR